MRLVFFYLTLLLAQGILTVLLAPLPAPDLFLLAVLALMWRLAPWQLVLIGYVIGLFQDILGQGQIGVHALALAGGAMFALFVKSQVNPTSLLSRSLAVLMGMLGKWLALAPLLIWMTGELTSPLASLEVAPTEAVLTLLASFFVFPFADALNIPTPRRERTL